MTFVQYDGRKSFDKLAISLWKNANLFINNTKLLGFNESSNVAEFQRAILFFDYDKNQLGVQFVEKDFTNCKKSALRKMRSQGNGIIINIRPILKNHQDLSNMLHKRIDNLGFTFEKNMVIIDFK